LIHFRYLQKQGHLALESDGISYLDDHIRLLLQAMAVPLPAMLEAAPTVSVTASSRARPSRSPAANSAKPPA